MSSTSNPNLENNNDEKDDKAKKPKKKVELFPPLEKRPEAPKIDVLIDNTCIFPKVGMVGNSEQITFIGHAKPVIKIILIKTPQYQNHLCTLSIDGKIKFWKINDSYINPKCLKSIDVNFEAWDILLGNNNNIIVCGEEILMLNLESDSKVVIQEKKYYKYVDYNLLARINDDIGVCTSLNDYYLLFDLNKGNIIKKIEFDKTHFICQMEKNQKLEKEKAKKKKKKEGEDDDYDNYEEEKDDNINEKNSKNKSNDGKENKSNEIKKEIQKMIRDLGSGKCSEYEGGHKGHVHALLGINTDTIKDSIISGAEDNLIKIININNPRQVFDLSGHKNTVESLVLDNSQKFLYSGGLDYQIKKWDLNTKECIMTMGFNNAFQTLLLYLENNYFLSIGVNSKIKLWNEDCLNVKSYKYSHGYIKSGVVISYDKEYNKVKFIFGDNKGDIFVKQFIIGEENIKKFNEYNEFMLKKQREAEERAMKKSIIGSNRRSVTKLSFKNEETDKTHQFKESTYETENTET